MAQTRSIKTKLIMAVLALVASVALMAVTADDANAAGVTEIRSVENDSPYYVYLRNYEAKDSSGRPLYTQIRPHGSVSYNKPVPWARDHVEFNQGHYIELGFRQGYINAPDACFFLSNICPEVAIWQEGHNRPVNPGDFIRSSRYRHYRTGKFLYSNWAPPVPGASHTGGSRNLIISAGEHPTTGFAVMQLYLERA
jgi:hypothetical protein